ncbi:hypothetical protein [Hwanghaeella sp.]|uniref:hypothetical protein n=1 Tax=Hwanghaeella sp. TaxID=2605943 RepID=UPI003CCC2241
MPDGLTKSDLKNALDDYQLALKPCTKEALAVSLGELTDWISTFSNVTAEQRKKAIRYYAEVLRELPSDLAYEAVLRVRKNYRFPSLPKPGDLAAAVRDDLLQRRKERNAIETGSLTGQERPPAIRKERSEADKARVAEIMAQFKSGRMGEFAE